MRHGMNVFLLSLVSASAAAFAIAATAVQAAPLATYQFSTGYTTFGLALPAGAAQSGVRLGTLVTQTDVKTRWPDGSIRFAVVSAQIPAKAAYDLNAADAPGDSYTSAWPAITLELVIDGATWTASPGTFTGADTWLNGPVVRESRVRAAPRNGASGHPLLEVVFDIRAYAGGAYRIDFAVQNVRDSAIMDKVGLSSAVLKVNGTSLWTHGPVTSYSMTRWRRVQWFGGQEAGIVPDFEPAYLAGALPRVLSTVVNKTYDISGANYDLMGGVYPGGFPAFAYGEMNPDMAAGGGRPEIGALNWWEAIYLVHRTENQRQVVLRNGDLSGAWSNHLSKPDGTMVKLGDAGYDPSQWWWDGRSTPRHLPLAPLSAATNFRGAREGLSTDTDTGARGVASRYNEEHVPAPMYVAYLISGDRYYVDQAKYWATSAILHSGPGWQATDPVNFPGWKRGRNGATGNERILDFSGMTREFGWPMRLVAHSAWMVPDGDSDKAYLVETVQNNLNHVGRYLDMFVRLRYGGALGLIGGIESASGWDARRNGVPTGRYTSVWRMIYTTYSVDWAARQNMWTINASVNAFIDRVASLAVKLTVQNPEFLSGKSGLSHPYYPCYVTMSDGVFVTTGFDTFSELKTNNEQYAYQDSPAKGCPGWNPNEPETGYYNVDHHVALQIALQRGLPDAQLAADRLARVAGHAADLNMRAGFAITFSKATAGRGIPPGLPSSGAPGPPTGLRIR